jgi:hypothetical protein
MLQQRTIYHVFVALLLLGLLPAAIANAHGDEVIANSDMGGMKMGGMNSSKLLPVEPAPMSYFRYPEHSGWIYAHIFIMMLGWVVVLPLGKRFEYQPEPTPNLR